MGYWDFVHDDMIYEGWKDKYQIIGVLFDDGVLSKEFSRYIMDRFRHEDLVEDIIMGNGGNIRSWYDKTCDEFVEDYADVNMTEGESCTIAGIRMIWHDGEPPEE